MVENNFYLVRVIAWSDVYAYKPIAKYHTIKPNLHQACILV